MLSALSRNTLSSFLAPSVNLLNTEFSDRMTAAFGALTGDVLLCFATSPIAKNCWLRSALVPRDRTRSLF